ncbi:carbamoyltransferase N-terminal domain-containing protein, partial [Rheinheimera baltica]|uniref:carbamoyltransferase N-terminal domain-containing protein n=1 Tax=Rheinheimera baltica TaxID=67576 RepID=UPI00273DFE36
MANYYIGLSTSGHDPAFAIANDQGRIIFAEASERFTQVKRAWGIAPDHADHISPQLDKIIAQDPRAQFHIATSWTRAKQELGGEDQSITASPSSALVSIELGNWIMGLQAQIHQYSGYNIRSLYKARIPAQTMHFDHHLCHAANAIYSAPFENAIVLVADGEGETGSLSVFRMKNRVLKRLWRSWGPGSIGTFYCWLTSLCGFDWVAGEEWKVMGLAAYGKADMALVEKLEKILLIEDG